MSGRDEIDPLSATQVSGGGAPAAPRGTLTQGQRIERFIVERLLGAGAMGVVYAARDPELDRQVAIKLIRAGSRIGGLEARLFREAQALARVAHPNVVIVHEVGMHDEQVYVAMELVRGTNMREWLEQPRDIAEVLRILVECGRGLAAAHAADLVHRDFKPDNVLIGDDGRARVTDFGLARAQGDADDDVRGNTPSTSPIHEPLTQTGMMVGTPVYASAEQLGGERVGPETDQFAFCVVAFEALYGARPFEGSTMTELRANVEGNRIVAVPAAATDRVPRRIRDAILRGLSPDPARRFPSMNALLAEFTPAPPRGKRVWIAGGALIAAGGIAVAAVAVTRSPSTSTESPATAPCSDAAASVTAVWNDQASQQLRAAFVATKSPHAEVLYQTAAAWYTRYANELAAAREATCKRPTDAITRIATACLDVRLTRFKNNVANHLKNPVTARVQTFLVVLDPVATCLRDKLEDRRENFDEVTMLRVGLLGDFSINPDQVSARIDTALAKADAFGYAPLRAELLLARAIFVGTQDMVRAEVALRSALTAAESAGDDRTKTQAATRLVDYMLTRGKLDDAAIMIDQAAAALARFGPDVSVEADVMYVRGRLAMLRGQTATAVELLEKAVTLHEANISDSAPAAAALAAVYDTVGRGADAAALRARIAQRLEHIGEAGKELLRLAGLCVWKETDDLEKALERCKGSIPQIERYGAIGTTLYANAHLATAELFEQLDRPREALPYYEQAAKTFELRAGDRASLVVAHEGSGRVRLTLDDHAGALPHYEAALAATDPSTRPLQVAMITAGIGRSLVGLGRHADAITRLTDALDRYAKLDHPTFPQVGNARFALAKARWARNAKGDRTDAVLDAGLALQAWRGFLARLQPTDANRLSIELGKARQAEIEAWLARHKV